MNQDTITQYISNTFSGVAVVSTSGDYFYFYDPDGNAEANHKFPFATVVTSDNYDTVSNLNRSLVFRLNIGVSKQTFRSLFASQSAEDGNDEESSYDFTALNTIMPHPVYGKMYWICVLNPGDATFETVKTLLAEAYEMAVKKHSKT